MQDFGQAFSLAFQLIVSTDPMLSEIVLLSLRVSISAVVLASGLGLCIGASLGLARFPGRSVVIVFFNALMGLPPVVVGLLVYMALSHAGPLGWLHLLYSPTAMIIAQTILVTPIIASLSRQVIEDFYVEYREQFVSLGVPPKTAVAALVWDARYSLLTVALAGFGRAVAEVGAVIIVGGNIKHVTRVMTTAIALETSKGDLALALALGLILILIALSVNATVSLLHVSASNRAYA